MGTSPDALPGVLCARMTADTSALLSWSPSVAVAGARAGLVLPRPLPEPAGAEPTVLHPGHHSTAACGYSNPNADLGTYQA